MDSLQEKCQGKNPIVDAVEQLAGGLDHHHGAAFFSLACYYLDQILRYFGVINSCA